MLHSLRPGNEALQNTWALDPRIMYCSWACSIQCSLMFDSPASVELRFLPLAGTLPFSPRWCIDAGLSHFQLNHLTFFHCATRGVVSIIQKYNEILFIIRKQEPNLLHYFYGIRENEVSLRKVHSRQMLEICEFRTVYHIQCIGFSVYRFQQNMFQICVSSCNCNR